MAVAWNICSKDLIERNWTYLTKNATTTCCRIIFSVSWCICDTYCIIGTKKSCMHNKVSLKTPCLTQQKTAIRHATKKTWIVQCSKCRIHDIRVYFVKLCRQFISHFIGQLRNIISINIWQFPFWHHDGFGTLYAESAHMHAPGCIGQERWWW